MKYTLSNGSTFVDDGRPLDQLPGEVREQLAQAAERVNQSKPMMCSGYAQAYVAWVNAPDAERPAKLRKLQAHAQVCACRGVGGGWDPLKEAE